jgi:hypothetical protein
MYVWNLVCYIKVRVEAESAWESGADGIFGPNSEDVAGGKRKLHIEKIYDSAAFSFC